MRRNLKKHFMDLTQRIVIQYSLIILIIVILSSVVFVNGCNEESVSGIKFSHKKHLDMGLSCDMCHATAATGMKAGMPDHEACITCHAINMKKPDKECLKCHVQTKGKTNFGNPITVSPIPAIFAKIQFSHASHVKAGLSCEACHPKIDGSDKIDGTSYPAMETCIKCHQMKKATLNCQSCHPTWDKDNPPVWHSGNWKKLHGEMSLRKNTRCILCHTQDACVKCHQVEEPEDHTVFWKKRGHAITVRLDRKKCITCHKVDFCVKCHENTPPSSHTAGWLQVHCVMCHLPKTDTDCIICHQSPNHLAVTHVIQDLPPNSSVPWQYMATHNCMACHYQPGNGATLPPHPPKFPCTACHLFN